MLGTANCQPKDDCDTPDGEPLDVDRGTEVFSERFVDRWRVTDDTSLFDHPERPGTADHTDMSMPERLVAFGDRPDGVVALAEVVREEAVAPELRGRTGRSAPLGWGRGP